MKNKTKILKSGTVQKVIKPVYPGLPEKAEISVEDADHLYREIRIENKLTDETGHERKLKEGAHVDVVIEADKNATVPGDQDRKHPVSH